VIEVETSREQRVQTWWLARRDARNAITLEMWRELEALATDVDREQLARVVIIRGRGEHFSAGADITGLARALGADHDGTSYRATNAAAEAAIVRLGTPTVAAIDGFCIGGGVQLALSCDIRLATPRAKFAVTPAKLGITYPANAVQRLVATLGSAHARELLLTGETIDAARAHAIGLVNHVVDDLDEALGSLTTTLLERSAFTQAASKSVIEALTSHVDVASLGEAWERLSLAHGDFDEGLAAFVEKRPPRFSGRPVPASEHPRSRDGA